LNLKFTDKGYDDIIPNAVVTVPTLTDYGKVVGSWNPQLASLAKATAEAESSPIVSHSCPICFSKDNLQRCSRCKNIYYCGAKHQAEHWEDHKIKCKTKTKKI